MPVGLQPSDEPNVLLSVGTGLITHGTPEEVGLDGHAAAWADDHSLMWQAEWAAQNNTPCPRNDAF